jgi:deazaflavin-dependent oxidoreductase (nitroreductase family)
VKVVDNVRVFNKHVLNPMMLRLAGRRYWYASVIEHTGRRSGKHYATPIATEHVPDGFVTPLPYGVGVDWVQNVLADGHATIRAHGQCYRVVQPEIISAEAAAKQLQAERPRIYDLFGVKNYLKMKSEPTPEAI